MAAVRRPTSEAQFNDEVSAYIRDMLTELAAMAYKTGNFALANDLLRALRAERLRMH